MSNPKLISKCCGAERVPRFSEVFHFFECAKCHKPCDAISAEPKPECKCACHDTEFNSSKLHSPVLHDKQCCDKMNGTLKEPVPTEAWEKSFDARFKYTFAEKDPTYGAENQQNKMAIKDFIRKLISQSNQKHADGLIEKLEGLNKNTVWEAGLEVAITTIKESLKP